jgi:hypothetical protein
MGITIVNSALRRRYEYFLKKRLLTIIEMKRLGIDGKKIGKKELFRDLTDEIPASLLSLQRTDPGISDTLKKIRHIDLELNRLEAKAEHDGESNVICLYCGEENENNIFFCKKCRKPIG